MRSTDRAEGRQSPNQTRTLLAPFTGQPVWPETGLAPPWLSSPRSLSHCQPAGPLAPTRAVRPAQPGRAVPVCAGGAERFCSFPKFTFSGWSRDWAVAALAPSQSNSLRHKLYWLNPPLVNFGRTPSAPQSSAVSLQGHAPSGASSHPCKSSGCSLWSRILWEKPFLRRFI